MASTETDTEATTTAATTTTPRAAPERRKSDFEIYRDGNRAATATSPGTQLHRERRMRDKELRALEDEYLSGQRAGRGGSGSRSGRGSGRGTSVVEEEVTEETEDAPRPRPRPRPRRPTTPKPKPSASSILSHSHPDPDLTPLPTPPLSRLHKRFATGTTPSPAAAAAAAAPPRRRSSKLSPTPVLAPAPADPDVSPLEHMRHLRAQFEALRPQPPSTPSPEPASPKSNPKPNRRTRSSPSSSSRNTKPTTATTADLLAHYTFTLSHLPALTHHSRTATLTLTPTTPSAPGHLTLNLRPTTTLRGGSHTTYTIPPHGLPITVTTLSPSSSATPSTTTTYALAELPLKHLPALRYAKSFVSVVQRATVVGRVEVRERCGGGRVWTGRRWADGRFEAVRGGGGEGGEEAGEEAVVVRIEGVRGDEVGVWVGGRRVKDVGSVRWEKVVDRAQRMWSACWRVLEEEEGGGGGGVGGVGVGVGVLGASSSSSSSSPSTSAATTTLPVKAPRTHTQPPAPPAQTHSKHIPFPIDAATTFVPTIGWCRRDARTGWWSMLFLDGVRLEIDPVSGDAVWTDGGGDGERRVLEGGMGMREVRERVRRFVERGL